MTFNELRDKVFQNYETGAITDAELVQIIEHSIFYLNLKTLTNTATFRNKSYNGVKNFATPDIHINGVAFYKNNE